MGGPVEWDDLLVRVPLRIYFVGSPERSNPQLWASLDYLCGVTESPHTVYSVEK